MPKIFARLVPLLLLFSLSVQGLSASTVYTDMSPARLELQRNISPSDIAAEIEEKDQDTHSQPTMMSYAEVKGATEDPSGQANPGGSQNPPQRNRHRVRNIFIGLAAMCVFAIVFAVASK